MSDMINNEDLLRSTINDIVVNSLEHMKSLSSDDRYAVLEEIGFYISVLLFFYKCCKLIAKRSIYLA